MEIIKRLLQWEKNTNKENYNTSYFGDLGGLVTMATGAYK